MISFLGLILIQCLLFFQIESAIRRVSSQDDVFESQNTTTVDVLWFTDNIDGMWEKDYLKEIFPPPYFSHVSKSDRPGVVVCSSAHDVDIIERLTKNYQLGVLVHISDEFMGENGDRASCSRVYNKALVVLRQYGFYKKVDHHRAFQIPLGYMKGLLSGLNRSSVEEALHSLSIPTAQRTYNWTFIGGKHGRGKKDRDEAIRAFSSWDRHLINESLPLLTVKGIYEKSKFVLAGRGWITLDCFRIYEALISGAIPIVASHASEISTTFNYNGHKPNLLFANSWNDALVIARNMSDADVDNKRNQLVNWYVDRMDEIHALVKSVFPTLLVKHH